MSNPAWKQFERDSAEMFGAKRFWSNSGERFDFSSGSVLGQCKLTKNLSLEALTQLAEEVQVEATKTGRLGVVCVKVRRGKGKDSPIMVVMTEAMWRRHLA